MKLILSNNEQLPVKHVNRNISFNNGAKLDTVSITFTPDTTIDTIADMLNGEDAIDLTISGVSTDDETIVFNGYSLQTIMENLTSLETTVSAIFGKKSE